jgi:predicted permease
MWEQLRTLARTVTWRIRSWIAMRGVDQDFTEELDAHLAMLIDEHIHRGVSPEDARRRALVQLGGITQLRELHREHRGLPLLDRLAQDVRYALRMFAKAPGFTVFAGTALALGIGATTAVFSVANAVLLRPLPYHDPSQLVMVWEDGTPYGFLPRNNPTPWSFQQWKDRTHALEDLSALTIESATLVGAGDPVSLISNRVTANFFAVLGVRADLGRTFSDEDGRPGAPRTVVLSHALWQQQFGADPAIIGRSLTLNDSPSIVIGIMPTTFRFFDPTTDIWVPGQWTPKYVEDNRTSHFLQVVGRLRGGVTIDRARTELTGIGRAIQAAYPGTNAMPVVIPLRAQLTGAAADRIRLLFGAVAFVLFIACANVANLLLARSTARTREMAVRLAVGAGRRRVVEQMLVESGLLASASGAVGLWLGVWGTHALRTLIPPGIADLAAASVDRTVLAFTAAVSLATGIVFGILPALRSSRVNLVTSLREGSPQAGGGQRLRAALVIGEVAVASFLLSGAALMIRSFYRLSEQNPGFRGDHVLTLKTRLTSPKYEDPAHRTAFYRDVLERVNRLPGVVDAGYTTWLPLATTGGAALVTVEHRPVDPNHELIANMRVVTTRYFRAIGMTLRSGRLLTDADTATSMKVAVINETMARTYWPDHPDPIGRRFTRVTLNGPDWITVVGVVGDMRQGGMDVPVRPEVYVSFEQASFYPPTSLAIRTAGDPLSIADAARRQIWAVDPDQPVSAIMPLDQLVDVNLTPARVQATLLGGFAGIALLLAALGIYSVLSFAVTQRTREIGVRVAVGAQPRDVMRLVLTQGLRLFGAGLAIGLSAALWLPRLIRHLLFEPSVTDASSYLGVIGVLAAVTLLACYLPARRAMAVDPLRALRWE